MSKSLKTVRTQETKLRSEGKRTLPCSPWELDLVSTDFSSLRLSPTNDHEDLPATPSPNIGTHSPRLPGHYPTSQKRDLVSSPGRYRASAPGDVPSDSNAYPLQSADLSPGDPSRGITKAKHVDTQASDQPNADILVNTDLNSSRRTFCDDELDEADRLVYHKIWKFLRVLCIDDLDERGTDNLHTAAKVLTLSEGDNTDIVLTNLVPLKGPHLHSIAAGGVAAVLGKKSVSKEILSSATPPLISALTSTAQTSTVAPAPISPHFTLAAGQIDASTQRSPPMRPTLPPSGITVGHSANYPHLPMMPVDPGQLSFGNVNHYLLPGYRIPDAFIQRPQQPSVSTGFQQPAAPPASESVSAKEPGTESSPETEAPYVRMKPRALQGSAKGLTIRAYMSTSSKNIKQPGLCTPAPSAGDAYLHTNSSTHEDQWWVCRSNGKWEDVTAQYHGGTSIFHPSHNHVVVLSKTEVTGEPTYVKESTHKAAMNRIKKIKESMQVDN